MPRFFNPALQVFPVSSTGLAISESSFTRTGLLGFIGPGGLIFVAGKIDGLMMVGGRRHNADDIVATALAVEPMKFVYRGRCVCVCARLFVCTCCSRNWPEE